MPPYQWPCIGVNVDKVQRMYVFYYWILVIGCDSLSWEHNASVYAVQMSVSKMITRRSPGGAENVGTTFFLYDRNIL